MMVHDDYDYFLAVKAQTRDVAALQCRKAGLQDPNISLIIINMKSLPACP